MSSYDSASIMNEKDRATASWREVPEKKPSKLSRLVTGKMNLANTLQHHVLTPLPAIKNIEPPEPVLPPNENRTSMRGFFR